VLSASAFAQTTKTKTYFHLDPAGTPLMATNEAGAVVWKETYLPYGEKVNNSLAASSNTIGYAGKPYDPATGLSYMGARYYHPTLGRFTGIDPVGFNPDNLHSHNRYAYANNNPYKYVDPDGRIAFLAAIPPALAYLTPIAAGISARIAMSSVYRFGMSMAIGETGFIAPASLALGAGKVASVVAKEAGSVVEKTASGRRVEDFTRAQKMAFKEKSALENGGKMACKDCSKELENIASAKGVPTPSNQAQVHHDPAIVNGGTRELSEGVVLCPSCHATRHAVERAIE
jgi:RHS repeat-associated protein